MVWASVMASAVLVWRLWVLVSAPYPLPSRPEPLPVSLSIIGEGSDRDWMPVLKHGAIYKIIHHNPYGLSEKVCHWCSAVLALVGAALSLSLG